MICSLHIEHYALIDELDIEFRPGFSVITGETGAGKSIILGAAQMLLGERADFGVVRHGEKKAVVEAELDVTGMDLDEWMDDAGLDFDGTTVTLRRELTAAGKSRAFVNDSPVSLATMRELGERLIDIHSQHQNLLLGHEEYQLGVLDLIHGEVDAVDAYHDMYERYRSLEERHSAMLSELEKNRQEEDYLRFQAEQLAEAGLHRGEDEELEEEQQRLAHAEEIAADLFAASAALDSEGESTACGLMRAASQALASAAHHSKAAGELAERMEACYIELTDIAGETSRLADATECDPNRLAQVEERLALIYDLERKHRVASLDELMDVEAGIKARLALIDSSDENLEALKRERDRAYEAVMAGAKRLSEARHRAADELRKQMTSMLQDLGMPHATFDVEFTNHDKPQTDGTDIVTFMFSANKNVPPAPLARVASGGETARVMLALKALTSRRRQQPTIIFDEIDTGVSGRIAERMAHMMTEMAEEGRQVISITHLPQIAARGTHHYRVYKDDELFQTTTHIVSLTPQQRIDEVAHMLSGATITEAARSNAKELLGGKFNE